MIKRCQKRRNESGLFFDKSKPHTISNDATNVTLNLYSKQTKTKNVETMHLAFTKDAFKEIGKLKYVQVAIDKKSRMIGFFKSDEEHGYKVSIHNGTNAQIDIGSRVLVLELKKLLGSGRRALKAVLEYDKKEDCYYIVVPEEK